MLGIVRKLPIVNLSKKFIQKTLKITTKIPSLVEVVKKIVGWRYL
jgi:hypothetical protein